MKISCFGFLVTALLPAAADKSGDLAELQGTWLAVSLINDGKTFVDEKAPPKEGPVTKLVYEGNKWMIRVGDKTVAWGIFKIDPAKKPKEIDILDESGTVNDKTKLGIYQSITVVI